jgi:hypothetical protein
MNYKTAAECYWDISGRERYWGGAIEVLLDEVAESIEISDYDKEEMRKALIQIAQDSERTRALNILREHLFQYERFQQEWALIIIERLAGKRPRGKK